MPEAARLRVGSFQVPSTTRTLSYRIWEPPQSAAALLIVHGFGEHSGRYEGFARELTQRQLTVASLDLWGHGQSGGRRGDWRSIDRALDELELFRERHVASRIAARRFSVFGHSAGGLLSACWARRRPAWLSCVILQSPLLGIGFPVPPWKVSAAHWAARLWPMLTLPTGLDAAWLSRDQGVVSRYRQDPLVHDRMTARAYRALQTAMQTAQEGAERISAPTLLLTGAADRIIAHQACDRFFDALRCQKRRVIFPDCYHELHHEPVLAQVVDAVCHWVKIHA